MSTFDQIKVARIVGDDGDKVILEVGKSDAVVWHPSEGDQFLTLVFVHDVGGAVAPWDPFGAAL